MSGFLSKLGLGAANRINAADSSQNLVGADENDPRIFYHLRPRARRISIKIDEARRQVIVAVPGTARKLSEARKFVAAKWDWIAVQLEALPQPQPFVPGGNITLYGELYHLTCPGPRGRPVIDHETRNVSVPALEDAFAGRTRRLLIREARAELQAATDKYASVLGKQVEKISVRDTRSRWGSCITRGGKGHISYSWRLIAAPPYVLDYVAAHECAHLVEMNHSAAFWNVVARLMPDYDTHRHWLKANGDLLHRVSFDDG
mgnify:CR=1 FL=1